MKIFIVVLVLIFSLQSWTRADDIRDFQIEGMSIGDSALKYFSENKIEDIKKNTEVFVYDDKTFYSLTFFKGPQIKFYDAVQFHLKAKDKKYIIYSISGRVFYKDKIEECYKKMNEVVDDIKTLFEDPEIYDAGFGEVESHDGHIYIVNSVYVTLKSGDEIAVECYDIPPEKNITDNLNIAIDSKEFVNWLHNEAYN